MPDTTETRPSKKAPQFSAVMERLRQKRAVKAPPEIERLPRDGRPLRLSSTQQRLWFIEQLHPGTATYNLGLNVELRGSLDLTALGEAFRRVTGRHESLRTRFADRGGEPFQAIVAEVEVSTPLIDLSRVAENRRELASVVTRIRALPFDLRRAPLLRAAVLRRSATDHVLVLCQHHIVADGWSVAILVKEAMAFYSALILGVDPRLPPLPIQYADYAEWQKRTIDDEALAPDLDFWFRHLEGCPPVLEVPGDRPRPAVQSHRGAMHLLRFSAPLTRDLRALARRSETTLFVVLMASFQCLLRRWTGQDDFVTGTPIAHRHRAEIRDLIGYFANTLALRARFDGRARFLDRVEGLHRLMLEAHRHQSVPFERLVEKLQPERSLSHTPLFQVLFTLQNVPMPRLELPGLTLEPLPIGDGTSIFDLTLDLTEGPERLTGWFDYSTDLFDPTSLSRLEVYFRNLLEGVAAAPEAPPDELSLMSAGERHQVLGEWNDTRWNVDAAGDRPAVPRLFEDAARRQPDAAAVVFDDEVLSYGGLNARANRLAHHLRRLGVGPESRVGVAEERSADLVASLLGILKAGGAYVPLDPEYPRRRLADMMGDAGLEVLITRRRFRDRLEVPAEVRTVELGGRLEAEPETDLAATATDLNAAYMIFTSGSTGRPKATAVPHRGVDNRLLWIQAAYPIAAGDRVLQKTPFTFDVSVWEFFWPLVSGATLVVAKPGEHRDSAALARRIERHAVTVVHFVPSMLAVFLGHPGVERFCAALRRVFVSGEALSQDLSRKFFRLLPLPLENLYGPTEASIEVTHWRGRPPGARVSIGRPIGNLRILLLDRRGRPVPLGVAGELAIGGGGVARGYFRRGRLTAERFVPDAFDDPSRSGARLYRSGDLARFLGDGQIEFLGRLDHQVKVRGFRIELGEIESRLLEHPAVREAVVTADPGQGAGAGAGAARLVAYAVAADPQTPPRLDRLRPFLKESLPDYMIPAALVVLEAMPLGTSGKLDRRSLPRPRFDGASTGPAAPRTPIEEALAGIWADVLGRPRVGIHDDFFDLGGHSLLATQVVSRVRSLLDVDLELAGFFEAPTVAGIAGRVEAAQASGRRGSPPPLTPQPRERPLPLSFAQERLWFLDRLLPGNPLYNLPVHLRVDGRLSPALFERVLTEVARRHEVLRTVYPAADGELRQRPGEPSPVTLPVADLSGLAPHVRRPAVERLSREEALRPFALASDRPLRAVLVREAPEEHALLLTIHHIASDGWSMGLLVREAMALYEAYGRGEASPLADLPVQYADFAVWQRSWLKDEVLAEELSFWREQLAGVPSVLELPSDRPRPSHLSYRGSARPVRLEPELGGALSRLARQEGSTLFMVLLASFQALLFRYTGQDRVAVGTPIAGRTRVETEGLIGLFVNTLVLCGERRGDPGFRDHLGRVRRRALEAYRHQDLPFEKLVEAVSPQRSLSHSPIFQVMLVLQNAPLPDLELAGLRLRPLETRRGVLDFDLALTLSEGGRGIEGLLEHSADLFDRSTIDRLWRHYTNLLAAAVSDPEQTLSRLALMGPAERSQVLLEWNDSERGVPRDLCLHRLFEAQVDRTPESAAVLFGESCLSYGELSARANQLARYLRRRGVGPEVLVGLLMERSLELQVALWGILKAGGAYLPLDPEYPRERLEFMLSDTGVEVVLTQGRLRGRLSGGGPLDLICLDEDWREVSRESRSRVDSETTGENLAYVIYTSGSTGRPKGVVNRHGGISNHMMWTRRIYPMDDRDVVLQNTPISFDMSILELCTVLLEGGRLLLARPGGHRDPGYLVSELVRRRVTTFQAVPSLVQALVDEPELESCVALRLLISGGEVVTPELVGRFFRRVDADLLNAYGPTETSIDAAYHYCRRAEALRGVPIGRPIDQAEVHFLDRRLQPVPIGVPGELAVGGAGVARGYLGRPALTAEKFVPLPFHRRPGARLYRTGDLARTLADGRIHFIGRVDHQIKLRGFRVELGEIEAVLGEGPGVREAAAVAWQDPVRGTVVAGYVVMDGGGGLDGLQRHLQKRLPDYMVPGHLTVLEALPLTPAGKVDRRALPAPEWERRPEAVADEAPRTPVEEALSRIWCEVLGLERVGLDESFFALGGHSLLATQIAARVRSALGVELALHVVFESPTVRRLAPAVEAALERREGPGGPPLAAVPRRAGLSLPLSFAQERMWFIDQLQPGSPAYNIPAAVLLLGRLRISALSASFAALVRRHESLRTRFRYRDGDLSQDVLPAFEVTVPLVDLSLLDGERRSGELARLKAAEAARTFDLGSAPLFRVTLTRLADDEHGLLLTLHHIIADGWSVEVLIRELAAFYTAFCDGRTAALPALPVQYADFAVWQRERLAGAELERQLAYWRSRLQGAPGLWEMPTDRPRPPVLSSRGRTVSRPLPALLADRAGRLARDTGSTVFMTSLAALAVLLCRWTGARDQVVATPVAGRTEKEVEGLIGLFINTLALRPPLGSDPSFEEVLERVRTTAVGAFDHQHLPFEKLVEELNPERNRSHAPLAQMLFTVDPAAAEGPVLPDLELKLVALEAQNVKFDMTLRLLENLRQATLIYSTDLFDRTTMSRFLRHFHAVLASVSAQPRRRLSEVSLLSPGELAQLRTEWNDSARDEPRDRCLHELFERWAEEAPERTALVFDGPPEAILSYLEVNRRANRLAHRLRELGVGPEVPVALYGHRSPDLIVGIWAILKAGGCYAPFAGDAPERRVVEVSRAARIRVLLIQRRLALPLAEAGLDGTARLICLDADSAETAGRSAENPASGARLANPACVIYTSGSTGEPKGVMVAHRNIVHYAGNLERRVKLEPGWSYALVQPLAVDSTLGTVFPPFLNGGSLHVISEAAALAPQALGSHLSRHGVDFLKIAPSHLQALEDAGGGLAIYPKRRLVFGGEASYQSWTGGLFERAAGIPLFSNYGPTETTCGSSIYRIPARRVHPSPTVPLGHPLDNVRYFVTDARLELQPIGVSGELCAAGAGVTRGYLNRPRTTAERYVPDPLSGVPGCRIYKSGDVVRHLPDGDFEFLGRRDHQVKIRGFRIELGEIETALKKHPSLANAAVGVVGDSRGGKALVGYVVPGDGSRPPDAEGLRRDLLETLPEHMVPQAFVVLEALPRLPHGKLDRKALAAVAPQAHASAERFVAPRDDLELQLAQIWEECFERRPIGVRDDFFELGGHSLLAVRLIAMIRSRFGDGLALADLFEYPTVERLAEVLRRESVPPNRAVLVPIQPHGEKPPFFCVHPVGGSVFCYVRLAHRLGTDQPFYGLQSPTPESDAGSLEDVARTYVSEIRRIQPAGPYFLGGWSYGGVVAFEMARIIAEEEGGTVGRLVLIDSFVPGESRPGQATEIHLLESFLGDLFELSSAGNGFALENGRSRLEAWFAGAAGEPSPDFLEALFGEVLEAGFLPAGFSSAQLAELYRIFRYNSMAIRSHEPRPFNGPVTLFRAEESRAGTTAGPGRCWSDLTAGGPSVERIPGNHYTILREPHCEVLAERLRAILAKPGGA